MTTLRGDVPRTQLKLFPPCVFDGRCGHAAACDIGPARFSVAADWRSRVSPEHAREPRFPEFRVETDLIQQPCGRPAGNVSPLFPRADRPQRYAKKPGKQALTCAQQPAGRAHVLPTIARRNQVDRQRMSGQALLERLAAFQRFGKFGQSFDDPRPHRFVRGQVRWSFPFSGVAARRVARRA